MRKKRDNIQPQLALVKKERQSVFSSTRQRISGKINTKGITLMGGIASMGVNSFSRREKKNQTTKQQRINGRRFQINSSLLKR